MKIGVLGSGNVGQALASGAVAQGHDVMIGSRDPGGEKAQAVVAALGPQASAGTYADTARFADVVFLTTPWEAAQETVAAAGAETLNGKVLVDVTNRLAWGPHGPFLPAGATESTGETVQSWVPGARVVKAFNHVGANLMTNGSALGETGTLFIAGNDDAAKATVAGIAESFHWDVVDMGGIEQARHIEALAAMWVAYARSRGRRDHAFKLIRG